MARGVNKIILVGNLGGDPEMKYTQSGVALCTFSMATSESFKDRDGNQQERTEWHKIVAWQKLAEICGQYLSKGSKVFLEGKIQTRTWEDQEGAKRYMTEIVAREVLFLGGKGEGQQDQGGGSEYGSAPPPMDDDDIPF